MNSFKRGSVRVPVWTIIIFTLSVLGFIIFAWLADATNAKTIGVLSGLLAGLIVYGLSFLTELPVYARLEKFEQTGVKNLLKNRYEKAYYRPILEKAERRVCVMGSSCSRFITDFLDPDTDDHVLIDRLRLYPQMKVQILVPQSQKMGKAARQKFSALCVKIDWLTGEFEDRFEIREFPHNARHSFVITDTELIAGPIFEGTESKNSPAVHVSASTPFAQKYIDYFRDLWGPRDDEE
ncbi:MAG: hypothetical protein AAGC95_08135 [Pseudomonadota bacterium]